VIGRILRNMTMGGGDPCNLWDGILLTDWVEMYLNCHNSSNGELCQWCWPNGGSYNSQPARLVKLFTVIANQFRILKENSKQR